MVTQLRREVTVRLTEQCPPHGRKTLMARDLQGFLGLTLSSVGQQCNCGNKGWFLCVWRMREGGGCVLEVSCGDMWQVQVQNVQTAIKHLYLFV